MFVSGSIVSTGQRASRSVSVCPVLQPGDVQLADQLADGRTDSGEPQHRDHPVRQQERPGGRPRGDLPGSVALRSGERYPTAKRHLLVSVLFAHVAFLNRICSVCSPLRRARVPGDQRSDGGERGGGIPEVRSHHPRQD